MNKTNYSSRLLYWIAFTSSLSTAGAVMSLIALSSTFFAESREGIASSSIQLVQYLGIACVGFFGGMILQKWSSVTLGIVGPVMSAFIVFYFATCDVIPFTTGLIGIFLIFLLNGIDHPNNLRFFNQIVDKSNKLKFFSFTESMAATLQVVSPIIAGMIIAHMGVKACFFIDGCTYLISALPWFIVSLKQRKKIENDLPKESNAFIGFSCIFKNQEIRSLTISRLLNNLAYVTCTTAIPLIIAIIANKNEEIFTFHLAVTNSFISAGFIGTGVLVGSLSKKNQGVVSLVYLTPFIGIVSSILLVSSIKFHSLLYLSACLLGIGTYCFRISGMTLGQAYTPPNILGSVIIAGDTIVRGWSFLVSASTLAIFEIYPALYPTLGFSFEHLFILNILPLGALFAPKWSLRLAKQNALKLKSLD